MAAEEASARQMQEVRSPLAVLDARLAALTDIRFLDAGGRRTVGFERRAEGLRDRTTAVLWVAFLSSTVLQLFAAIAAIGGAMAAVYVGFA